jgi:hypothetical protein
MKMRLPGMPVFTVPVSKMSQKNPSLPLNPLCVNSHCARLAMWCDYYFVFGQQWAANSPDLQDIAGRHSGAAAAVVSVGRMRTRPRATVKSPLSVVHCREGDLAVQADRLGDSPILTRGARARKESRFAFHRPALGPWYYPAVLVGLLCGAAEASPWPHVAAAVAWPTAVGEESCRTAPEACLAREGASC